MLLLALPLLFIFLLYKGDFKSSYTLPILGNRYYDADIKDTVYHTIPPFRLLAHTGDSISEKTYEGKIMIVNFFFTSCPDVCPRMNQNLTLAFDKYKNSPDIRFLSISVDPANDTMEALRRYAKKMGANDHWLFARSDDQSYILTLSTDFLVKTSGENTGYEHDPLLILVDHKKRVRGLYDGLDINEVNRMKEDIKLLIKERNDGTHKK